MKVKQGSAPHHSLRLYYQLQLLLVLLLPCGSILPLLLRCLLSLWARKLLRSPRVSVKPAAVFLGHLALCDGLVLLHWAVGLAAWMSSEGRVADGASVQWLLMFLSGQLLQSRHLASLLLLGLLGTEAALVLRWPLQTRGLRTSHWAQLSCALVWTLTLLELLLNFHSQAPGGGSSGSLDTSLPAFSSCLRRTLWLGNLYLHYVLHCSRTQKRRSSFR